VTLHLTVNKKHTCNVAFINVVSKIIKSEVFISIIRLPSRIAYIQRPSGIIKIREKAQVLEVKSRIIT
jgi:hypothetical protein